MNEPELPALCPRCMYNVEVLYHYLQLHALARNNVITADDLYAIFSARINNLLPPPGVILTMKEQHGSEPDKYVINNSRLVKRSGT